VPWSPPPLPACWRVLGSSVLHSCTSAAAAVFSGYSRRAVAGRSGAFWSFSFPCAVSAGALSPPLHLAWGKLGRGVGAEVGEGRLAWTGPTQPWDDPSSASLVSSAPCSKHTGEAIVFREQAALIYHSLCAQNCPEDCYRHNSFNSLGRGCCHCPQDVDPEPEAHWRIITAGG
jgi:hypothetical protein